MNPISAISFNSFLLRLAIVPLLVLSLVAASVATVSADPQGPATVTKKKVKYVKKYVIVVGSNIPVPVWEAEGLTPKTSVPIRTWTAEEMRKTGAATPAQGLANDPSITIRGLGR